MVVSAESAGVAAEMLERRKRRSEHVVNWLEKFERGNWVIGKIAMGVFWKMEV